MSSRSGPAPFAGPAQSAGPSVVLSDLSFSWPNGRRVLSHLSASFAPGRTGLIGVNGAGKSTLLRLIAGRLRPSSGSVTVTGDVGYLPTGRASGCPGSGWRTSGWLTRWAGCPAARRS